MKTRSTLFALTAALPAVSLLPYSAASKAEGPRKR